MFNLNNNIVRNIKIIISIFIIFGVFGCKQNQTDKTQPTVTVSIVPQQFFVNQIAGSWLTVNVMIPPGGSPATYEPTPKQMKDLTKSQAYFRIGHITFEKAWADKLASVSPNTEFVNTSEGLDLISEEGWGEEKVEQNNHNHKHLGYNPHIWLSPELVKAQANTIFQTLRKLYPQHEQTMKINLDRFSLQCDSVHLELDKQLKNAGGSSFIVYHPVWSYLARDYNLQQIAIEHNGKEPTADKLKKIIDFANDNNIRIVFVQKEFSNVQAETIAKEIDGEVATMNPLDYNWLNTMKEFGKVFASLNAH